MTPCSTTALVSCGIQNSSEPSDTKAGPLLSGIQSLLINVLSKIKSARIFHYNFLHQRTHYSKIYDKLRLVTGNRHISDSSFSVNIHFPCAQLKNGPQSLIYF